MNNIITRIWATVWVALFCLLSIPVSAKGDRASLLRPDFAFPKDVQQRALPEYEKALESGDAPMAIFCAMQLNVAGRMISNSDSILPAINRYEKIASRFKSPYSSLARILEAKLLAEVYSAASWKYNKRVLPADSLSAEPILWSGDQFREQISTLLNSAFVSSKSMDATPISDISLLVENVTAAENAGMTVLDFAIYQAIDIINMAGITQAADASIPFEIKNVNSYSVANAVSKADSRNSLSPLSLLDSLIDSDHRGTAANPKRDEALCIARLAKLSYLADDNKDDYVKSLLDDYPASSPLRPTVVVGLYNKGFLEKNIQNGAMQKLEEVRKTYRLLKTTAEAFPDNRLTPCIRNYMEQMMLPSIDMNSCRQWIPDTRQTVNVSINNIEDCNLLLVPLSVSQGESSNLLISKVKSIGKILTLGKLKYHENGSEKLPFCYQDTININLPELGISPGYYALIPSNTESLDGVPSEWKNRNPPVVNVSAISLFTTTAPKKDDKSAERQNPESLSIPNIQYAYVVDARTNSPIKGASVKFTNRSYDKKGVGQSKTLKTDASGCALSPYERTDIVASYDGSRVSAFSYAYPDYKSAPQKYNANIFTDLGLYHPGDSVQCAVIVAGSLAPADSLHVEIALVDANGKECKREKITTDRNGRAVVRMQLPAEGLTGRFRLQAFADDKQIGSQFFEVAEYKAPSFRVILDKPEVSDTAGENSENKGETTLPEEVTLSGSVMTYSGMPLSDSRVGIHIVYNPWWWRSFYNSIPSEFATEVITDASGRFTLTLGLAQMAGRGYESGYFTATASAISQAGETQISPSAIFSLSNGYRLEADSEITLEAHSDTLPINIKVVDFLGNPAIRSVDYILKKVDKDADDNVGDIHDKIAEDEVIKQGSFSSPLLQLPASGIPSGKYILEAILKDSQEIKGIMVNDTLKVSLIVWRSDDKIPPCATPLWVPEKTIYAPVGSESVKLTLGCSYADESVFCQIADTENILASRWLKPQGRNISIDVPAPENGNRVIVRFRGMHNLKTEYTGVNVFPAIDSVNMHIETITFRDKITPNAREKWRFRLLRGSETLRNGAAMAVMTNAALNAIAPFNWNFTLGKHEYGRVAGNISTYNQGIVTFYGSKSMKYISSGDCSPYLLPTWVFGEYAFNSRFGTRRYMKSHAMTSVENGESIIVANDMAMAMAAPDVVAVNEMKMAKSGATGSVTEDAREEEVAVTTAGATSDEVVLRDMNCPLAFFKPDLIVDSNGVVDVEFEVPNFNTQWRMQLLGYDDAMSGVVRAYETVASKPVMVSTNMPRFLLTGDKARISSMIFNNTDSPLAISGVLEIFDIQNGKVLSSSELASTEIAPSQSVTLSVTYDVPVDYSLLGVRTIARSDKGGDGEQSALAVLPSSQPVTEAYTLYLQVGHDVAELKLPSLSKGKNAERGGMKVTLNYCANPSWYVLTSLSGILNPDTESAIAVADAIYANAVSSGLVSKSETLKEGLQSLFASGKSDSLLVSPLYKNSELKLQDINSTPWINNAAQETQHMAGLESLLDKSGADAVISGLVARLGKTQKSSGGWSWMKEMPASLYITKRILCRMASLKDAGYLPVSGQLAKMTKSGLKFADNEMSKDYNEIAYKYKQLYPLMRGLDYLNMRMSLTDEELSGNLMKMRSEVERRLPDVWRKLSIFDKASAVIYLSRRGNKALAEEILQSIAQSASYKSSKGMWFDNIEGGNYAQSKFAVVARVLEAFSAIEGNSTEVAPDSSSDKAAPTNISKLCQYLVLSRQVEDWNNELNSAEVAEVANAILCAVPEWTSSEPSATHIFLGDKEIPIPHDAGSLVCGFFMNLDTAEVSGKTLRVEKSGGAPAWGGVITQYVEDVAKVKARSVPQLKVEKRLLPLATDASGVKAGNAAKRFHKGDKIRVTLTLIADRDMDYVILRDGRAACLEPQDQLTRHESQDGMWMLRETRNYATNFYFVYLPKGRHIISYDVVADRDGEYSIGIAEAQSQYYPLINAHSAGAVITVE